MPNDSHEMVVLHLFQHVSCNSEVGDHSSMKGDSTMVTYTLVYSDKGIADHQRYGIGTQS